MKTAITQPDHKLFRAFKVTVYSLLALNVALFIAREKFTDTFDSIGWLILVGLFEYETMRLKRHRDPPWKQMLELLARVAGYTFIVYAWIGYLNGEEWLNLANATTWILVGFSLEYDVRIHAEYGGSEWRVRNRIKFLLYGLLLAYVLLWALAAEWLDCLDASLWLLAFFVIELNVFGFEQKRLARQQADEPEPA